jgi:hypothetical protein
VGAAAGHGDGGGEGDASAWGCAEGDQAGAEVVGAAVVGGEGDRAVLQGLLAAGRGFGAGGGEQDELVAADGASDGAAGEDHLVGDRDEGGVHGAFGNLFDEVVAVVDVLLEVDVGQFGVEDREQDRREAGEGADDQVGAGRGGARRVVHLVEVAEDVRGAAG